MKIKIFAVALITIIFLSFFSNIVISKAESHTNNFNTPHFLENAWLRECNGVNVLYVNGSHYEMGYQHGFLLKYECQQNIRAVIYFGTRMGYSFAQLVDIWNTMAEYVPLDYIEEMQGLADGAGVSFNEIAAAYTTFDCLSLMNCFGIAAWGPATLSDKLIHGRSVDIPFIIKDPITEKYAYENSVLTVRNPDNDFSSLVPTVAGILNLGGGINEKGIGLSCQISWSKDQTLSGLPLKIKLQMVIDKASTANEAINIVNTSKTMGFTFIISDSKIPIGYAVETTSNLSYIGTWDDPIESKYPFWSINNVVRRTNLFIDPEAAATQRSRYNPGGFIGLLKGFFSLRAILSNKGNFTMFTLNSVFPIWWNYNAMSKEIEEKRGTLDLENTMLMLRNVYNGETNRFLKMLTKLVKGYGFLESWNQWVACPETGDMLVSFASDNKYASKNPVHQFNLFELLNS